MHLHPNAIVASISYTSTDSMPPVVHSDSITFESLTEATALEIQSLFDVDNPHAFEYASWSRITAQEDAERFIETRTEAWNAGTKFSYLVKYNEVNVGCMYAKYDSEADVDTVVVGLWLHPDVWGENLAGRCNDILFHLVFTELAVNRVRIECLIPHQSRKTIEKTIERYGGTYCGTGLWGAAEYADWDDAYIPYHQYVLTDSAYFSGVRGISCSIPGVTYSMLDFGKTT